MSKQKLDDVKLTINKLNPLIEVLNEDYRGTRSTIICRCRKHNLVWESNIAKLSRNAECQECKSDRRILEIRENLSIINPDILILDNFYTNAKMKIKCQCKIDSTIFYSRVDHLLTNHGCPTCGHKKAQDNRRYSLEQIREMLTEINPFIEKPTRILPLL